MKVSFDTPYLKMEPRLNEDKWEFASANLLSLKLYLRGSSIRKGAGGGGGGVLISGILW